MGSTDRPVDRRRWDRRANAVAASSFVVGGSLFAIGAALAQGDVGGPLLPASVYLAGGVFFCSGGYSSVLLAINMPHRRRDGSYAVAPWRWWALGAAAPGLAQRRSSSSPAPWSSRSTSSTRSSPN